MSGEAGTGPVYGDVLTRLEDVRFAYGSGTLALAGVSFEARAGEFLTFVGPSGCGKSTILRLLAGLSRPSSGTLELSNRKDRNDAEGTHVSIVFQDPTLLPWRSSLANVWLPLELAGVGKRERRAAAVAALEKVGLDSHLDALPRHLSGGMRMRVAIARALVADPDLLLMDEPFGALDAITRERLQEELLKIWSGSGRTVVFVTHSVDEAVFLSSRIAVMTPRPGTIARMFDVPIPYPRTADIRTSDRYRELQDLVHRALYEHLGEGEGDD